MNSWRPSRIPSATYRLQLNAGFRFSDAERLLEYLHELGITDVYASPLLKARSGTAHGYDVTDPARINPEIGSEPEFAQFIDRLHANQLGLLLDIVPNHMAANLENPWWWDILAKGESSAYSKFFDIDWSQGKILLPVLGRPYGECLEAGELSIRNGALYYFDHALPLRDPDVSAGNIDELDRIISSQHYRPAHWKKAIDANNYRRFFDINDLVGLRTERDDVYTATHARILDFVQRGMVNGLRIDHIDGLVDPKGYLERLPATYVVVEKVLGGRETIPLDWKTCGTTGYDFLNIANRSFIDAEGYAALTRIYSDFTRLDSSAVDVFHEKKRQVMRQLFAGEVAALTDRLLNIAQYHRHARDLAQWEIREALLAVTACLAVYRTYIRDYSVSGNDRQTIDDAMQAAGCQPLCAPLQFLRNVMLMELPSYMEAQRRDCLDFVMRWQQFTGPVMAKGLEDTTFYVHNPFLSVNEVGGNSEGPDAYFGVGEFHRRNLHRQSSEPFTMNASSTHDTKRSEDARARINVLSEMPDQWEMHLNRWRRWNAALSAPDRNEQVMIYQTLLGSWPISRERLHEFLIKALREGKTHTSWLRPNESYEQNVLQFVDRLTEPAQSSRFLRDFLRFQKKIAWFGMLNSLSQTLLKITSPGVPDFYQGMELWDFSVADPDNRRSVDFGMRMDSLHRLQRCALPPELLRNWEDGRIKMFVVWRALNFRRDNLELFLQGDYIPLEVTGSKAKNVIAFARRLDDRWAIVAVPRLCSQLMRAGKPPLGSAVWRDTTITPPAASLSEWRNVFTGAEPRTLTLAELFSDLPFTLLSSKP